ncbi:DUF5103 domain-containing protein [Agriterribacter sp.]|uniref:type IX secretion system plug protein n=1 Tax=Agriterribacter sp. TaxID=2821509 RepID=UPI002C0F9FE2|nr:DUF5103 domain-containing protein [Agriterribacter sp.]HTN08930.1 DUF5103 domain-containing protein [Agriterribacter sp.]
MYKRYFAAGWLLFLFLCVELQAQREPDKVFQKNIKTVQLNPYGDQTAYPVIRLNSSDLLQLDFDDMDGDIKNYYYNIELRNADWSAVQMGYFDYAKGYTSQRISTYRRSAQVLTRYTHYQLTFPGRDIMPTKPGNYVVKVFLNGDTSKLAFTKRFLVTDAGIAVSAQVQQPFGQQFFRTHQKIQFTVNAGRLNVSYPQQQIKVVILQNNRWDNCIQNIKPSIVRNNIYEYNTEKDCIMPAMREWRWLDLTSFRLLSDRVRRQENTNTAYDLYVIPDPSRNTQRYIYYKDYNGIYAALNNENVNPYWNADYATVHFTYKPPGNGPYAKELYLIGQITNYGTDDGAKMRWNQQQSVYETTLQLKQGYYDYAYALADSKSNAPKFITDETEGNIWETENQYTILVYYRELGGRYDQLMNVTVVNSLLNRPGQF